MVYLPACTEGAGVAVYPWHILLTTLIYKKCMYILHLHTYTHTYNICHIYIIQLRRSVRSCSQTIPEALAKFWRAAGPKVKAFAYMVRKLRSIAFQRCIWRGGLPLVEMAENKDFLQKKAWKTGFLRDTNRDQLTLERAGAQNLKNNATLDIFYEKYGP